MFWKNRGFLLLFQNPLTQVWNHTLPCQEGAPAPEDQNEPWVARASTWASQGRVGSRGGDAGDMPPSSEQRKERMFFLWSSRTTAEQPIAWIP